MQAAKSATRFCQPDKTSKKKNQSQTKLRRIKPKPDKTRKKTQTGPDRESWAAWWPAAVQKRNSSMKRKPFTRRSLFTESILLTKSKQSQRDFLDIHKLQKRLSHGGGRPLKKAGPFFRRPEGWIV